MKIFKNIPIPPKRGACKRPFDTMKVGDCFIGDRNDQASAAKWKKSHPGWNYTMRKNEKGQWIIWRTQ